MTVTAPEQPSDLLRRLLKEAANRQMTAHDVWQQRVSFAFGNASLDNPSVTRETVEREAVALYGPCPPEQEEGGSTQ